ncbi:MAG: hypothetical protein AAFY99_14655 [Pseudomonadota bacterium]
MKIESMSVNGKELSLDASKAGSQIAKPVDGNAHMMQTPDFKNKSSSLSRRSHFLEILYRTREESIDELEEVLSKFKALRDDIGKKHATDVEDIDADIKEARLHLSKLENRRVEIQEAFIRQTLEMESAFNSDRLALEANIRDADSLLRGAANSMTGSSSRGLKAAPKRVGRQAGDVTTQASV